jgi:hypothetical protein
MCDSDADTPGRKDIRPPTRRPRPRPRPRRRYLSRDRAAHRTAACAVSAVLFCPALAATRVPLWGPHLLRGARTLALGSGSGRRACGSACYYGRSTSWRDGVSDARLLTVLGVYVNCPALSFSIGRRSRDRSAVEAVGVRRVSNPFPTPRCPRCPAISPAKTQSSGGFTSRSASRVSSWWCAIQLGRSAACSARMPACCDVHGRCTPTPCTSLAAG